VLSGSSNIVRGSIAAVTVDGAVKFREFVEYPAGVHSAAEATRQSDREMHHWKVHARSR